MQCGMIPTEIQFSCPFYSFPVFKGCSGPQTSLATDRRHAESTDTIIERKRERDFATLITELLCGWWETLEPIEW